MEIDDKKPQEMAILFNTEKVEKKPKKVEAPLDPMVSHMSLTSGRSKFTKIRWDSLKSSELPLLIRA
jgi:hypothetical protein